MTKFDELELLTLSKVNNVLENRANEEDEIEDLLIIAYSFGVDQANSDLSIQSKLNLKEMKSAIDKKTAGETFRERLQTTTDVERLARTEAHRVFNQAILDIGMENGAKTKTWVTMGDQLVRDTHDYLEGMTVPIDKAFYTFDGDSAMFPSDFQLAQNNVNCRCYIQLAF